MVGWPVVMYCLREDSVARVEQVDEEEEERG